MIKIVTILGARPQFIKAGSVSREFAKREGIKEVIVHTGQHYDSNMSDVFFDEMRIPKPDYFLGIGGKSHGAMTGQMIEKIENILQHESPDWVLVYGDTNSTLAGALAASKLHIKIAHVEAGLRSFNMDMPEEVNRILTDRVSSVLFCPTRVAVVNLEKEGYEHIATDIVLNGDVMQDGAMFYRKLASSPIEVTAESFILCTFHRAENTDDEKNLSNIVTALNEIANETKVVLPIHPRTKQKLLNLQIKLSDKIQVINPVGYLNMIWLIENCSTVITDSGGLQKEAFFFNKPCITMRTETEWLELVNAGVNMLVGTEPKKIMNALRKSSKIEVIDDGSLYGGGTASKQIADYLLS